MNNRSIQLVASLGLAALLIHGPGCKAPTEPSILVETLLAAPELVEISQYHYLLETCLWRDFMPICPPDGMPLIAVVKIIERDSLDIPQELDATRLWVVNDGQVWETTFSEEDPPVTLPFVLEKVARDGPKWGPRIYVEVIVRLVDGAGNACLLRASDQWILRTD